MKTVLDSYPELFRDEIGELKGMRAKLTLKENAHPSVLEGKASAICAETTCSPAAKLQQENIISPVETSEWATPIVPVPKKNGGVRICSDFKVTVNANLHVDHYPLPKI